MPVQPSEITNLALQFPTAKRRGPAIEIASAPLLNQFVLGEENQAIRELFRVESISDLPSKSPILLYGASGVGKTALALSLVARWVNEAAERTLYVTSATDFSKSLLRSIESDDMARFRTLHRTCDCLFLDNVHELVGKDAAQSELVEILNAIELMGGLVILTSMPLPSYVPVWNDALVSRVLSGYSLEIQPPGAAVRLELLKRLSVTEGLTATDDELSALANQVSENSTALQLRGMITRWRLQQRVNDNLVSNQPMRSMESLAGSQSKRIPTPLEIAKAVAREMQQTLENLRGPSRRAAVVRCRGLAMLLIRQWTDTSYQSIGETFGGRDHTTVMHACKKTEEDLARDAELAHCADRVKQKLM